MTTAAANTTIPSNRAIGGRSLRDRIADNNEQKCEGYEEQKKSESWNVRVDADAAAGHLIGVELQQPERND